MDFPVGGQGGRKSGPLDPQMQGEFRETVLTETETPPLANTAFGHMHLFSSSMVQLEGYPPLYSTSVPFLSRAHKFSAQYCC